MSGRCREQPGPCPHDVPHGDCSTYSNHRCRCEDCRAAWAAYCQGLKLARQRGGRVLGPHGRYSTYTNWMCRCPLCREAMRVNRAGQRSRRAAR